uniref:Geranylgeranyl transferase type-2 subunit alpha n=1 Tax=Pristionchus pacificus TaxID=54126 RepID=A0A4X3N4X2_PRIPA|eukprot:PDM70968.1 hypothetical protein PRIPAC_44364 [Pristionchus pacificus]
MRMSLISRFKDEKTGEQLMRTEDVKEEIKRIANAIFTDPEDESAWMYARHIINLYSPASFLNNESSCPVVPLSASLNSNRLIVVFTRSITVEKAVTFFKGIPNDASWRSVSLFSSLTSRVWECVFDGKEHIQISNDGENFHSFTTFYRKDLYDRIVSGGSVDVIDTLREHCEELLQEENGNSLAVMTMTDCLRLTSPLESHRIIMENLDRLATTLDPLRANIYKSFADYERIRHHLLIKNENGEGTKLDGILEGEGRLSLAYLELTELPHIEILSPFLTDLDVRGNKLKEGTEFGLLPLLTHLSIDENPINCLPSSICSLSQLEFLSSSSTLLTDISTVGATLLQCSSLKRFLYCQTPIVEKTNELRNITGDHIRLIPHYL